MIFDSITGTPKSAEIVSDVDGVLVSITEPWVRSTIHDPGVLYHTVGDLRSRFLPMIPERVSNQDLAESVIRHYEGHIRSGLRESRPTITAYEFMGWLLHKAAVECCPGTSIPDFREEVDDPLKWGRNLFSDFVPNLDHPMGDIYFRRADFYQKHGRADRDLIRSLLTTLMVNPTYKLTIITKVEHGYEDTCTASKRQWIRENVEEVAPDEVRDRINVILQYDDGGRGDLLSTSGHNPYLFIDDSPHNVFSVLKVAVVDKGFPALKEILMPDEMLTSSPLVERCKVISLMHGITLAKYTRRFKEVEQ